MDWSMWGSCSVTCRVGQMTRQRQCLNPRPKHGGRNCTGNSLEHKTCHPGPCRSMYRYYTCSFEDQTSLIYILCQIRPNLWNPKSIYYDFNVHIKKKEDLHIPIMVHAIGS